MRIITLLIPFLLLFGSSPAWVSLRAESLGDTNLFASKFTNQTALVASADDPAIVNLVGQILQRSHYQRQHLDDKVSSEFLDQYLDALDPQRLYFLQSDLEEFDHYRYRLDNLILESGDAHPARLVFNRFRTRLDQQYDYVMELLRTETFTFEDEERYVPNRKDQPRARDMEELREFWRERLRYEYLQEKLGIGRPEEIAKTVLDRLNQDKADTLNEALKDKLGKERLQAVLAQVKELADKESPSAVATAVRQQLEADNAREIVKIISRRYNRILRSLNEYDNDDVLQLYLTSLAHVYDPHSDYMGRAALENFSIGMKLSLFGIGALLRSEDGYCKIVSLTPNGPAEKSKKLSANDRIIAVAQGDEEAVDVVDMKLGKVVDLIRGPKGTEVRLTIIPDDAPDPSVRRVVTLVRDEIKLEDQEAKAKVFEMPVPDRDPLRLGLIDLPSFYASFDIEGDAARSEPKSTTSDVSKLIRKLKEEQVAGLILDLRRNGGGSLEEAINLTGLFIKEGPVVQVREPGGQVFQERDPDPSIFYDGPLIVLTSRFSASASEILAGALQDYGRAVIVGDNRTHGKGTVQSLIQLGRILRQRGLATEEDPGAIKITIRKFYRASGGSTQLKGVEPDIVLPSVNNHAEVGEDSLENAMEWTTIDPATFDKMDLVAPYIEELRNRSVPRVERNADFDFVRESIERYKKALADRSVSMNEAQRLQEKQEADDRAQARKKELENRPKPPGKVFEITLKDVDKPGLPEPAVVAADNDPATAAAAATGRDTGEDAAEEEEDPTPAVDIQLEEVKRILTDYIELSARKETITAAAPGTAARAPVETGVRGAPAATPEPVKN